MKLNKVIKSSIAALVITISIGACSSHKAKPAADSIEAKTDMKPTKIAKNDVSLGGASSGRAR